jgi:hypothetical protein
MFQTGKGVKGFTDSMKQIPSVELNNREDGYKYPSCYEALKFITLFTRAHHSALS